MSVSKICVAAACAAPMLMVCGPAAFAQDPFAGETFLSDYSALKPVPSKVGQDYIYAAPGAEELAAKYTSVMVDQPEVHISPDSPYKGAKPDELKSIAEAVRSALIDNLKAGGYEIVDEPSPQTLYLRTAITELQLAKKRRGVLAYTPVGLVVHAGMAAMESFMKQLDILDFAAQVEVRDSVSGDVLAAAVMKRGKSATPGAKEQRLSFNEITHLVAEIGQRTTCRLDNAKLPVSDRIDCTDPEARKTSATRKIAAG